MKTTFHKNLKAFTLCAGFFSLVACKEKSVVKPDLIPPVDNIYTFEVNNLTMSVKNSYFDSLRTNDVAYPVAALGSITNDAFFGKTAAGIYLQFIPPSENFAFPAGTIMDSAILSIPYVNFSYGDTSRTDISQTLKLKAFEITDNFAIGDGTTKYYSFSKLGYNTTPVGSGTVPIKSLYDTTVLASGDTVARLLRFRVDGLKDRFINMTAADLANATSFQQQFKGLYIAPDTNQVQNSLAYFGLSGANSTTNYSKAQLEFYSHTTTDPKLVRSFFRFNLTSSSFFNSIYRNYNGTPAFGYLNNTANQDTLLVQGYPGFHSDMTIKIDNKIPPSIINKAAITLTVLKTGDEARFNAPPLLFVTAVNTDGTERVVDDMLNNDGTTNTTGQSFIGGSPVTVTINGLSYIQYTLNIPRELQRAISAGNNEFKLRFSASVNYAGSFRMLADGPNSSNTDTKLKFNVIYTKIK